jgi:LytS/YehU family sensor histidine kinase
LFNLLNTLAYLIRTNPTKARELTLDLSEFLRYTLAKQDEQTSLKAELDQIERYVDLERARFGEGLQFRVAAVDEQILDEVAVPPLILQPLVENAIRHGARDGKVELCIEVIRDDDMLSVKVLDEVNKGKSRVLIPVPSWTEPMISPAMDPSMAPSPNSGRILSCESVPGSRIDTGCRVDRWW